MSLGGNDVARSALHDIHLHDAAEDERERDGSQYDLLHPHEQMAEAFLAPVGFVALLLRAEIKTREAESEDYERRKGKQHSQAAEPYRIADVEGKEKGAQTPDNVRPDDQNHRNRRLERSETHSPAQVEQREGAVHPNLQRSNQIGGHIKGEQHRAQNNDEGKAHRIQVFARVDAQPIGYVSSQKIRERFGQQQRKRSHPEPEEIRRRNLENDKQAITDDNRPQQPLRI